jgi:hypothetical protein
MKFRVSAKTKTQIVVYLTDTNSQSYNKVDEENEEGGFAPIDLLLGPLTNNHQLMGQPSMMNVY